MHADRKKITWNELYKKIYLPSEWCFWNLFDFDNIENGRVIIKKYNAETEDAPCYAEFQKKYPLFMMSGDADFGLKGSKLSHKMHKFPNFSLTPVMGGMNDRKGHLSMHNRPTYNDNFPKFLYTLSLFWKAEEEKRLSYVIDNLWFNPQEDKSIKAVNTAKCLTDYLLLFKDIYEYSERIYLIDDEDFVRELCDLGETGKRENRDERYMKMAESYFEFRIGKFKKYGVDQQIMDSDISEDRFE